MIAKTRNEARSLIVVSKDYGELGLAISFVRGQSFAARTQMLLPDSLYLPNKESLPVAGSPYGSLENILTAVDIHEPDLVFFFSGYLIVNDGILSLASFDALMDGLRDRGCRCVTSDPFLGLGSRFTLSQIDPQKFVSGRPFLSRWLFRLALLLRGRDKKIITVPNLDDLSHLYPTSVPDTDGAACVQRLSYFNPDMLQRATDITARDGSSRVDQANDSRPRWLFLLSSSDLDCQRMVLGLNTFTRLNARILQRVVEVGRRPIMVAPTTILKMLSKESSSEIELLPFCPFSEFETLLLEAEYVFYWNTFSFSMLPRMVNELPFFVFDRGHVAHLASWMRDDSTFKAFFEIAISCHFGGWSPSYLDPRQPLDPGTLSRIADEQKLPMRLVHERWQSSATPDEVVEKLLRSE